MTTLWFDLDEMEDDEDKDKDAPNYEKGEDFEDELYEKKADEDGEEDDIICPECGAVVEDGVQCQICGYMVAV